MARTLTPERQKSKQEALSLRYDYGLSVPAIMAQLNLSRRTIYRYVCHNPHSGVCHNNNAPQLLEGDCLELLKTLPDKSVDVLLTDPPYSIMGDYQWDKGD
nr:hypothetical protein [Dehalococcoidia bacterium]